MHEFNGVFLILDLLPIGLFKLTNNRAPGSHQLLLNGQSRHTQVAPTVSTGHRLVSVIRPGLYTEPIQIQSRAPVGLEPPIRPAAFIPQRPQNRQEINRPMRVHLVRSYIKLLH